MSVVLDILRAYKAPREVFARRLRATSREGQALAVLMAACILVFVAQAPRLQRLAIETGQDFEPLMGGALFGWLFIMPLAAYALGWITHLLARAVGRGGTGLGGRLALFWALLVASPLWLLWGLTAGFVGQGTTLDLIGILALAAFLIHWGLNFVTSRGIDVEVP